MLKQFSPGVLLVIATTLNAQTYEYSGTPKSGLHAANLEETLDVIRQVTGSTGLHVNDIRPLVDVWRSTSAINKVYRQPLEKFLESIGINPTGFFLVSHSEGAVVFQMDPSGSYILRFVSATKSTTPNLYVKQIAPATKLPRPKINTDFLKAFLELLSPEQRIELFKQLKEYDVEVIEA